MSIGRPPKSAAQHKAEGTYRQDRHGGDTAIALQPILQINPPCWLPATLIPTWRNVTGDLCAMGAVCPSDLGLLEQAFRFIMNSMMLQTQLQLLLESVDRNKQLADQLTGAFEDSDEKMPPETAIQIAALASGCASEISKTSAALVAQEAAYERILGKFGITPAERSRLVRMLPKKKSGEGLDDLLQ
jgi:hypothetical protein